MNKLIFCLVFFNLIFNSCENSRVGYRFSNFENSPAEKLAKAIKRNDIKRIREEVINKKVDINSTDDKFKCSLLSLSIVNDKKESFLELLKLGANPNQENPQCESPLILAIRLNSNCDLYYIKNLISYNADLTPGFFNKCNFAYDPILETILHYNEESKEKCGIEILNVLTKKLGEIDLDEFNNSKDYMHNIIYFCLKTGNLSALKFFIMAPIEG